MPGPEVSQTEVWDDSDLVKSWNEALEEYKKYHSLAAKGEKVYIADLRAETALINGESKTETKVGMEAQTTSHVPSSIQMSDISRVPEQTAPPADLASHGAPTLAIPQALMAAVNNDDMKNLMMSWYYAGYYTGLYEGKQQGYALAQENKQAG